MIILIFFLPKPDLMKEQEHSGIGGRLELTDRSEIRNYFSIGRQQSCPVAQHALLIDI